MSYKEKILIVAEFGFVNLLGIGYATSTSVLSSGYSGPRCAAWKLRFGVRVEGQSKRP
ncbi:MAG: hypothetical protein ACJAW7_002427 [Candidatus Azotimanducaceae bacterium]|jgi:hypothetical protein